MDGTVNHKKRLYEFTQAGSHIIHFGSTIYCKFILVILS